jgi:hypothetical protein
MEGPVSGDQDTLDVRANAWGTISDGQRNRYDVR